MKHTREFYETKALESLDAASDSLNDGSVALFQATVALAQVYATLAAAADPEPAIRLMGDPFMRYQTGAEPVRDIKRLCGEPDDSGNMCTWPERHPNLHSWS